MPTSNDSKLKEHVTFCARGDLDMALRGSQAELDTVQHLVTYLDTDRIGEYQILVNYNMPVRGSGAAGTLEIDLVVITKFGVFLIEVKDWQGIISAYQDYWLQGGDNRRSRRSNALVSIEAKARTLHGNFFGRGGELRPWGDVNVVGLVVLARGTQNFRDHCRCGDKVLGLSPLLTQAISQKPVQSSKRKELLSDLEILRIKNTLYREHEKKREVIIKGHRIVKELSPGTLFQAFEAVNVNVSVLRVRIKQYELDDISKESSLIVKRFRRNAVAVSTLGPHPNILQTFDFFPDANRPDTFYEITELPQGERLDEFMANCDTRLSLQAQLNYIEPLCEALIHAHKGNVYHRSLSPETIFVTQDGVVKLADFDFAKMVGEVTIVGPDPFVRTSTTAPEMISNPSAAYPATDIYSLGALWYFLASLPEKNPKLDREKLNTLEIPPAANELIGKMLTQAIKNRPQSAEEVLEQLKSIRKGGAASTRKTVGFERN